MTTGSTEEPSGCGTEVVDGGVRRGCVGVHGQPERLQDKDVMAEYERDPDSSTARIKDSEEAPKG